MEVLTNNKVKKLHDNECYIFDLNNQITPTLISIRSPFRKSNLISFTPLCVLSTHLRAFPSLDLNNVAFFYL